MGPKTSDESLWWGLFVFLTILAVATRLYKIEEPDHVWYVACLYSV